MDRGLAPGQIFVLMHRGAERGHDVPLPSLFLIPERSTAAHPPQTNTTATVMLSFPPASHANSVSSRATSRGVASAGSSATSSRSFSGEAAQFQRPSEQSSRQPLVGMGTVDTDG